jgi:DNA polymerase-3 subunit delta
MPAPDVPKPVYALVGPDGFLQSQRLAQLLRLFPSGVQRVDFEGERAELAQVLDELRSYAMFGGGAKLVTVRDADEFVSRYREQLEKYVAAPSSSATLVLRMTSLPANQRIYKLIQKFGQIEPCAPPAAKDLRAWIAARAPLHKAKIAPDAAQLLADCIGDDMGRLDTELAKLALQSENGAITAADVRQGVAFGREQEMWDMTNQIAAGKSDEALRRWRQMVRMDASVEFRAVTWLGMWLEKAAAAAQMRREGMNAFAIGGALKIWPRDLQEPFVRTAQRLGIDGAMRAVDLLAQIDYQSKTGVGEAAENVERFLLEVGNMLGGKA